MIELAGALAELGVQVVTDQDGRAHLARETDLPAILLGEPATLTTAPTLIRLEVDVETVVWQTEDLDAADRLNTIN